MLADKERFGTEDWFEDGVVYLLNGIFVQRPELLTPQLEKVTRTILR